MLTDGIISLRALEPVDVDTLYRWENDPAVWGVGHTIAPYSRKQLWDYVNNYDADIYSSRQLRLMIDLLGTEGTAQTVGTLDLYDFDPANSRCGAGILIAPDFRRRGYGLRALSLAADYCRGRLSLHQLYCIVGEENTASRRLFEKAGYTPCGRLKSWLRSGGSYSDAYICQKFL